MNATIRPYPPPCPARLPRCRWDSAFTLTELLVTVAIAGILAALAAPSMSNLIASQRNKAIATDLYTALSKARSEAIKRNTNVVLSQKAGGWENGWEIIDPSDASKKIEDHNAVSNVTITGPESITYRGSGRVQGNAAPALDITINGTTIHTCVTVSLSGLPTQKSSSC